MRRDEKKAVRVVMKIKIEGKIETGTPKINIIENDMRVVDVYIRDVENPVTINKILLNHYFY
jgi:hypothetical protein